MIALIFALVARGSVPQPTPEPHGRWKLVLRNLAVSGLPPGAYIVVSQPNNAGGPVSIRLVAGKTGSSVNEVDGPLFDSRQQTRLFRRGADYLLAFDTGSGTALFTNFVLIESKPPRLRIEGDESGDSFQYAPLHHFQKDGRFEDHRRHMTPFSRHWLWSTRRHKFVVTGIAQAKHWNGWNDETLK